MIHLHTRSCSSLLESPIRIEQIIEAAKENHQEYAALTERNVMYSAMSFLHQCQKNAIRPIIGLEARVALSGSVHSMLLYAKNNRGLSALFQISTQIGTSEQKEVDAETVREFSEDLIILTSGMDEIFDELIQKNEADQLALLLEEMQTLGADFYVSIALNDSSRQREDNRFLKTIAHSLLIPTVALSRIDYMKEEDAETLRLLQAIDKGKNVMDPSLRVRTQRYWRSAAEMRELYEEDDLNQTDQIASMIDVSLPLPKSTLPEFRREAGDASVSSSEYLRALANAGLKKRLNGKVPEEYRKRLDDELNIILSMGFADYFLIVWDFIRYARKQDILIGPGRGSAAGSLTAYCLGITHIDPIQSGLLFERFLNPERISLPDIDTDIPDDRRDELIAYLGRKYGEHRTAHIVTFATLKARMAIRDTARALSIHTRVADRMCALLGNDPKITLQKAYDENRRFRSFVQSEKAAMELYRQASRIEGLPRHASIHAGGIVISGQRIENYAPLIDLQAQIPAVQFTMEFLEELGLIKFDLLGLKNLSVLQSMNLLIEKRCGRRLDLLHLPLDDPKVYQLLSNADTLGVFQLESDGIRALLRQFRPRRFEDIAAVIALYRPGPMKNISIYLNARNSSSQSQGLHPLLDPILSETGGIFLYQEQIMQSAQIIGGFSLAQADSLRKAMSKKNRQLMDSYRNEFIEGAEARNIEPEKATEIFEVMERFADYGFNKSHSYAYALIVYQMAYIKANYPMEFYLPSLNSAIGSASKTSAWFTECLSRNIRIYPADINLSQDRYVPEDENGLRIPFNLLKGLGPMVSSRILEERKARGPFTDLYSALARLCAAGLSTSSLEVLIKSGAFDRFGFSRTALLDALDRLVQYARMIRVESDDVLFTFDAVSAPAIENRPESPMERAAMEKEAYGLYISEHPAVIYRKKHPSSLPVSEVKKRQGNVETLGVLKNVKPWKTRKGEPMCFASIEDENGTLDLAIMPDLYGSLSESGLLEPGRFLLIRGKKDARRDSVLVRYARAL